MSAPVAVPVEEVLAGPEGPPSGGRLLGRSREGREILGWRFGRGPLRVSLIGGCHADEPVGPAALRRLAAYLDGLDGLEGREPGHPALAGATWFLVPHANPDGEERNRAWSDTTLPTVDGRGAPDRAYDLPLYLRHAVREPPGDDVEFGFPHDLQDAGARPENRAVAAFLAEGAPFHLHASFHGMGFAPGPWFLLEESWADRTAALRENLRRRARELGYEPFDVDRGGEKGFRRIDEGFTSRPDSRAMRAFFEARGEPEAAALFRPSSMEYVRSLGGDPLTFVTEMPLFLRPLLPGETGRPDDPLFRDWLAKVCRLGDEEVRAEARRAGMRGMPVRDQMRLQLAYLNEALGVTPCPS